MPKAFVDYDEVMIYTMPVSTYGGGNEYDVKEFTEDEFNFCKAAFDMFWKAQEILESKYNSLLSQ